MAERASADLAGLIGRDDELAAVRAFLAAAGDRPSPVLVLEGDPGIGKTTLWRAGVREAEARGFKVLTCAASGTETQLSFSALHDVIGDVFAEVAGVLPAPQRRALAVTLLLAEPRGPPPEQSAIAVAVLNALRALAQRGDPVILAIDDVHWLDPASASALAYALRRLGDGQVRALLARRPAERDPLGLSAIAPERVDVVEVGPLSVGAVGRILAQRLGTTYARPTLHRLREESLGNPLMALELARALGPDPPPVGPGSALPVPGTFRDLVRGRLRALDPRTLDALSLAAALSRPTLELIGEALEDDAMPLLVPAVEAQLVVIDGDRVQFAHPLFGAAVYELTQGSEKPELHKRLAGVVRDSEERARHLAVATRRPDEEVAMMVEQAAAEAHARARPAAAAELAAHARRLTPAENSEDAHRRALAQVDYHFAAGATDEAARLLEELLSTSPSGADRARLLSRRARVAHFRDDVGASVRLLREALTEAGGDAELRADVEEGLAWGLLLIRQDLPAAADHARSAAALNAQRADDAGLAEALAAQALVDFALGRPWRETMARALALEDATRHLRVLRHPTFANGYCLSCSDALDEAEAAFAELERRAVEQGDESSMPSILNHLTLVACLDGRWEAATRYAEEGHARALESGQQPTQTSILAKKALVTARRGELETAREEAWGALGPLGSRDFDPGRPAKAMARGGETALWTLGFVELSLGNPEEAHRFLGPMTSALLAAGIGEPGEIRCLPDEVEALVALGRADEAEALAGRLEEWARRLERPSAHAAAGRCRALILGAAGSLDEAIAALEDAAAWSEQARLPFEHARLLLELGTSERRARQRRKARETLERAEAIFEGLGAGLWAERTRAELSRIGGRAPSGDELTATEHRIAELVAEGKTNKEVAAILVVSDRTIESALTQIYRKLEIRSRTELARRLAALD